MGLKWSRNKKHRTDYFNKNQTYNGIEIWILLNFVLIIVEKYNLM